MGRKKQPVAVLKENKSRHYSKAQLEEREAGEVQAESTGIIPVPKYLKGEGGAKSALEREFEELAPKLQAMGVLADVDGDCLARYLVARKGYEDAALNLMKALNEGKYDTAEKWSKMQDRFFKQCRAAAGDIGLGVSARANLVIGGKEAEPMPDEEVDLFGV